jgi:hypothetical protein
VGGCGWLAGGCACVCVRACVLRQGAAGMRVGAVVAEPTACD